MPTRDNYLGDEPPTPTDADGRAVAGSQDFGVLRNQDGHRAHPDDSDMTDAQLDVDYYGNIHRGE